MLTGKKLLLLLLLFSLSCPCISQYLPLLKDDTIRREKYYQESLTKKDALVASLEKKYARDYKKIYEDQFIEISSIWKGNRAVTAPLAYDYLQSIVARIISTNPELKGTDARVVFSRDWWPNAASMGDGTICINAGLLVYLDNEAELVFVICHELAHYYLQHTAQSIKKYVETVNSPAYQQELKRLSKTAYATNKQLDDLSKSVIFNSRRHSRDNETAADRYAFHFMKTTGYDCGEIRTCLNVLDGIDDSSLYQPLSLPVLLDFPGYPFKKKWIQQESSIFSALSESDSPLSAKEKDSLKTHPDCIKRIALLKDSLEPAIAGQKFLVNEQLFRQLKKAFSAEIAEECYRQESLSRNLYYSLQLMQDTETKPLGIYAVVRNLNRIYDLQRDHHLGAVRDIESKGYAADYNLLLRLLDRLRLEEVASLAYYLGKQNEALMKDYPGFKQEMNTAIKNKN